ncbi:MAG: hypothetical protein ACN6I7_03270 [bacterium]
MTIDGATHRALHQLRIGGVDGRVNVEPPHPGSGCGVGCGKDALAHQGLQGLRWLHMAVSEDQTVPLRVRIGRPQAGRQAAVTDDDGEQGRQVAGIFHSAALR